MLSLNSDIKEIGRVGQSTAKKLKKLGIENIRDLLLYFPWRYDDFSKITKIKDVVIGDSVNIIGTVEIIQNRRSHRRRMSITEAFVNDGTDTIKVIWFNQPFIANNIKAGDTISLAGKVEDDFNPVMRSPMYEKINRNAPIHTQGLVPNYHLTAGLTQKQLRFIISQVVGLAQKIEDWLPTEIKKSLKLVDLGTAINKCHFPKSQIDVDAAHNRLAFNELFILQLESQLSRQQLESSRSDPIKFFEKETVNFVNSLPFKMTNAQRKTAWEIIKDIGRDRPMARLLEGDVGSGKTLVACLAMLNTALNKKQSVLMVPTEILARQHYETIKKLLGKYSTIALLTHSQFSIFNFQFSNNEKISNDKISKKFIINSIKNGNSKIIIGTHALIQEKIKFNDLALAIIDEQHRFGVEQRKELVSKSGSDKMPHLLSMTATPIPRSLALALYGDLDISIINELPKNRKKIITRLVAEENRNKAYKFIADQITAGRQVFVVCPLIDFSDKLGVKSVEEEYTKLDKVIFPELKIAKLHGRMKSEEKEKVMQDFLDNKTKILVSTSVIEVGVDVPNASVMMIEGAERFGLAQIHQFRGRVGRSEHQSYCFLFTNSESERSKQRLESLVKIDNGFDLAKIDLKFRGPGEVYGTAQKGFPELKVASLFDYVLMKKARDEAIKILNLDSSLNKWPKLKEIITDRIKDSHRE